jgi:hypothetical protein
VGKSSSAKKVARLANKQGRRRVRTSQGRIFPLAVGGVVAAGLALVVYAKVSYSAADSVDLPDENDEALWYSAVGTYTCDAFAAPLAPTAGDDAARVYTVLDDGVVRMDPGLAVSQGDDLRLGPLLDQVGMTVTSDELVLPDGETFTEGETKCGDEDGDVRVAVWDEADSTDDPKVFLTDFENIRFLGPRTAVTVAFVPEDVDFSALKPPAALTLDDVADADTATPASTVPGQTTSPTDTTAPAATGAPSETTVAAASPTATTASAGGAPDTTTASG